MGTVAQQFWKEILEVRRPIEPATRTRPRPRRAIFLKVRVVSPHASR